VQLQTLGEPIVRHRQPPSLVSWHPTRPRAGGADASPTRRPP
jgi:hypothetical protein